MAKLPSEIRFCAVTESELGKAIATLNASLFDFTGPKERFVTLAAVVLDPATHACTLVTGGFAAPLLYRPDEREIIEAMRPERNGLPPGLMEGEQLASPRSCSSRERA